MPESVMAAPNLRLAERFQRSMVGPPIRAAVSYAQVPFWVWRGRPVPSPPHLKRAAVVEAVRRFRPRTFVETGTYRGDTLAAVAPLVDRAVSIELDPALAACARRRVARLDHVEIRTGDSAAELGEVLASIEGAALFWLDGHYSGGPTAGEGGCPLLDELDAILNCECDHVILIDDIRLFDGTNGYPRLDAVSELVAGLRPDWVFRVENDIAYTHVANA